MNRQGMRLTLAVLATTGMSLCMAHVAFANHAQFPINAKKYFTTLVRAMDQCTSGTVSVVGSGPIGGPPGTTDPAGGCIQANTVTDDPPAPGATFTRAQLAVVRNGATFQGKIRTFGFGFVPGQRIKVQLTLRTTQIVGTTKHPPGSNKRVTFQDVTLQCGVGTGGCFTARPSGALIGQMSIADCLTQNGVANGVRIGNIEILDAALINCDTNKIFAVPGIRQ